jgi:hypothetical protein
MGLTYYRAKTEYEGNRVKQKERCYFCKRNGIYKIVGWIDDKLINIHIFTFHRDRVMDGTLEVKE